MPAFEPLSARGKIALAAEILREYPPSWRALGRASVIDMVRSARDVRRTTPPMPPDVEHAVARRLGRAVTRTLRLLPTDSRCLIRSLVLTRMLTRRSIPHTLVIGVRNEAGFEAHAWVEHGGMPILPAGAYTRLTEL